MLPLVQIPVISVSNTTINSTLSIHIYIIKIIINHVHQHIKNIIMIIYQNMSKIIMVILVVIHYSYDKCNK